MTQAVTLSVSTQKTIYRGEKFRRILAFSCYEIEDLPIKYFEKMPVCFKNDDKLVVVYDDQGNFLNFGVGDLVSEKDFHRAWRNMKYSGHKLCEINTGIRQLKKEWFGKEDFEI